MPEGCIATECRECKYHVIVGGRLDCNWQNRLGLKGATVEQYTEPESEEVIKRKIEQKKKELEELKKSMEELKKVGEQISKATEG